MRPIPTMFLKYVFLLVINSVPNDKFPNWSKLKAFSEDEINMTEILKFVLEKVENIVGKGENAGYQHFSFTHNVFKRILL